MLLYYVYLLYIRFMNFLIERITLIIRLSQALTNKTRLILISPSTNSMANTIRIPTV